LSAAIAAALESDTMNADKRRQIFERLRAANPEPQSELDHQSPF